MMMKAGLLIAALLLALPVSLFAADGPKSNVKPSHPPKADVFFTPEQDKGGMTNAAPVDTALPNVLILGDSISIGYTKQVREELKGKANVIRPNANCGDTRIGLANIDKWLGERNWSVIHFNWGLWDLCYRKPEVNTQIVRDKVNGTLNVPLPDYEKNLETLVQRLKRTGATLIWASTTVVPEGEAGRFVGDEVKYNAAATRIMQKYRVMLDDLYATTKAFGPEMFRGPGDVHYTPQGYKILAAQVVTKVAAALKDGSRGETATTSAQSEQGTTAGHEIHSVLPRMYWADSARLGRPFSKDPSVIQFNGRYLMYFSLPPYDENRAKTNSVVGWSIGIARSTNLVDWEKIAELTPEQSCEKNGLCAPGARVLNGEVHLFYQTYGNGPQDAICHAKSKDGVHFQRDPSNPVFRPTGNWNSGRAIDAEVFPFKDELLLYFATRDPLMKTQMIGVASAPLHSDFGRSAWRQRCDAPVLKPELPWEFKCIEAPTLLQRGDTLFMFYAGGYNCEPQQIGVAASTNGLAWYRLCDLPMIPNGRPGEWNSSESGHPGVLVDAEGRTILFYQGNQDKGKTWYLSCRQINWQNNLPVVAGDPTD
jgi:predicted GH43/DUF377 family glycosyl hydrolase